VTLENGNLVSGDSIGKIKIWILTSEETEIFTLNENNGESDYLFWHCF
jgi:hypothetical protein